MASLWSRSKSARCERCQKYICHSSLTRTTCERGEQAAEVRLIPKRSLCPRLSLRGVQEPRYWERIMAKRTRPKAVKPDEVMQNSIFSVARYGKNLVWKSNLTKESHAEYQKRCIEQYPKTVAEIDELVATVAEQVTRLPPEMLLHRAWWEMASKAMKIEAEVDVTIDDAISMRMIDYVQSIVASVKPADEPQKDVTEEDWKTLRDSVDKLFGTLNMAYQICRTAKAQSEDPEFNEDVEEFFYKAQIYWCNVRGSRYQVHEEAYLRDVFLPHSPVFEELFGVSAEAFI